MFDTYIDYCSLISKFLVASIGLFGLGYINLFLIFKFIDILISLFSLKKEVNEFYTWRMKKLQDRMTGY
jgi:hypothetical protein